MSQTHSTRDRGWAVAAVAATAVVLLMTLWPDTTPNEANFVPFQEKAWAWTCLVEHCPWARESADFLIVDGVGNILGFVPLGFAVAAFVGGSRNRRFWLAAGAGMLLSLVIEMIQLGVATRATDVDDVILNTAGAAIGAGLAVMLTRRRRRQGRAGVPAG